MLVFQMRYQMRYVDKTSTVLKQTKFVYRCNHFRSKLHEQKYKIFSKLFNE